jgi:hypothetical protein
LNYDAGERFDKTGLAVFAFYDDETSEEIFDYVIVDGERVLTEADTSITSKGEVPLRFAKCA